MFAINLEELSEDSFRDRDKSSVDELYFSNNDDSELSITSDFASNPVASKSVGISTKNAKKCMSTTESRQNRKSKVTKKVNTETNRFNAFMLALAKDRLTEGKK